MIDHDALWREYQRTVTRRERRQRALLFVLTFAVLAAAVLAAIGG